MQAISIIPVRGGSRRLPRKNVLPFCGHPLMAWTIVQARCSHEIDYVYVTTDDDEMAEVAEHYGAEVIRRPEWPDADEVAANRPLRHAVEIISREHGDDWIFNGPLVTQPCRFPDDIDRAIRKCKETNMSTIMGVNRRHTVLYRVQDERMCMVKFDKYGRYWQTAGAMGALPVGQVLALWSAAHSDRDADLDDLWWRTITDDTPGLPEAYIEGRLFQSIDADTREEFELAEMMMENYILKGRGMDVYYEYGREKLEERG